MHLKNILSQFVIKYNKAQFHAKYAEKKHDNNLPNLVTD